MPDTGKFASVGTLDGLRMLHRKKRNSVESITGLVP